MFNDPSLNTTVQYLYYSVKRFKKRGRGFMLHRVYEKN